jgi:hypothetical protein
MIKLQLKKWYFKFGKWGAGIIGSVIAAVLAAVIINNLNESQLPSKPIALFNTQENTSWNFLGGTWEGSNEHLFGIGASNYNNAYRTNENYSDFVYEVRLRKVSANDDPIGLLLRYDEKRDEGYMLLIWPIGEFEFSRLIGQRKTVLKSGKPEVLVKGEGWNTVKIIAKSSQMRIFINGEEQPTANDDKYLFGKIGLVVYGGPDQKAEFKILNISSLSS